MGRSERTEVTEIEVGRSKEEILSIMTQKSIKEDWEALLYQTSALLIIDLSNASLFAPTLLRAFSFFAS